MLIKRKSLVVALTTGCILAGVLVLTLVGYLVYTKVAADDFARRYETELAAIRGR